MVARALYRACWVLEPVAGMRSGSFPTAQLGSIERCYTTHPYALRSFGETMLVERFRRNEFGDPSMDCTTRERCGGSDGGNCTASPAAHAHGQNTRQRTSMTSPASNFEPSACFNGQMSSKRETVVPNSQFVHSTHLFESAFPYRMYSLLSHSGNSGGGRQLHAEAYVTAAKADRSSGRKRMVQSDTQARCSTLSPRQRMKQQTRETRYRPWQR